jgi:hypothetical protein
MHYYKRNIAKAMDDKKLAPIGEPLLLVLAIVAKRTGEGTYSSYVPPLLCLYGSLCARVWNYLTSLEAAGGGGGGPVGSPISVCHPVRSGRSVLVAKRLFFLQSRPRPWGILIG